MKIMTVVGARPQFIKAAPFSAVFRKDNEEIIVHTGQHYDKNMSDVFFNELSIPKPDYNLEVGSKSHGAQTGRMLEKIEELLVKEKPDGMLVYGDTNSTLAGALAASKLHIPIFHVEAGLRSYNKLMPEEQNRVLTDHISDMLLCPTQTAITNLEKEGITKNVYNTGDIMYDAVLRNIEISKNKYTDGKWKEEIRQINGIELDFDEGGYYLATVHRAENTDDTKKLAKIVTAFSKLDKPVLLPLHPRTRKLLQGVEVPMGNITVIEPVGYLFMLYLISQAYMVVTDSGGLQKEAYFLKTPCTTLRDQTEWVETLENKWNVITKINCDDIIRCVTRQLDCFNHMQPQNFGDGYTASKICRLLEGYYV